MRSSKHRIMFKVSEFDRGVDRVVKKVGGVRDDVEKVLKILMGNWRIECRDANMGKCDVKEIVFFRNCGLWYVYGVMENGWETRYYSWREMLKLVGVG